MMSAIRMCDRIRTQLQKRQLRARSLAAKLEIQKRANRKLRHKLGLVIEADKIQRRELRLLRRAQLRLPL